jgi:hypothetical protein
MTDEADPNATVPKARYLSMIRSLTMQIEDRDDTLQRAKQAWAAFKLEMDAIFPDEVPA